ncbi:hypothetical protein GV794_18640 [Nocardia cyriacigeorgica]|uniref:Uncharacterized protein n=1 Tax=Nocardia cyriacigeorgica TaxID=135487 RepID=A0A6P1DD01_9NOCA|nr:hypothetical protein [Nocardia cyriacigeorgica]NEW38195.1 hypothetical protein [Nocardia cyriacigeorgica]NEW47034.1 hypothetical protein [Nocardia cyriacigeorgica]NEW52640.1 hypothetical protein [Nocardia cyriacigeorgica]NEW57658.1 hypothetical protein [Nocardia cyriacigeorgica]
MRIRFLGRGGSGTNDCPTLYATDQDSYIVQGWTTDREGTVEIPHLLIGFAEPRDYIGATLADTGRGTFTLSGRLVKEPDVLDQLTLAEDETAIEVPRRERTFYGATAERQPMA